MVQGKHARDDDEPSEDNKDSPDPKAKKIKLEPRDAVVQSLKATLEKQVGFREFVRLKGKVLQNPDVVGRWKFIADAVSALTMQDSPVRSLPYLDVLGLKKPPEAS